MLRTYKVASNMLQGKTLGDPDLFTEKTTWEILGEIRLDIRNLEQQKYSQEKSEHDQTKEILEGKQQEIDQYQITLEKENHQKRQISNKIGSVAAISLCILLLITWVIASYLSFFNELLNNKTAVKYIVFIVSQVFGAIGFGLGLNVKSIRNKIREHISEKIMKALTPPQ